jgi:hypothetical protein
LLAPLAARTVPTGSPAKDGTGDENLVETGDLMRRMNKDLRFLIELGRSLAIGAAATACAPGEAPPPSTATVFEGARLITGDGGAAIESAVFVVDGGRFTQVGPSGQVEVPEGAARVDLTGKTVMPAIINTHLHLGQNRAELVTQLEHSAFYGVGAVMSLGTDSAAVVFQVRDETIPNAARYRTAWRGITRPEEGRTEVPYWINTAEQGRAAVQDLVGRQPASTRLTRTTSVWPHTSSPSTTPRGFSGRASTSSRTVFATRKSTTRPSLCSRSTRQST